MGIYKTIYNYFGWLIQTYLPDIKHYAYYFNQEFDANQLNSYPAIYIEANPTELIDLQGNLQLINFNITINIFANVLQSFTWNDKHKEKSGDFLDLFDRINRVLITNNDVPSEYLSFELNNIRRTGFKIIPTSDNIKQGQINFSLSVYDNSLTVESQYTTLEDNNLELKYDSNNI
jgi:hypothetical protein